MKNAPLEEAEVLSIDEPSGLVRLRLGADELSAPLHHAALCFEVGDTVTILRDGVKPETARVVTSLEALLPELRAQGLFGDVEADELASLVELVFGGAPAGFDGPDILQLLYERYGRVDTEQELVEEEALARAVRDRVLVFDDAHETPDLVEDAVAALADALLLDVMLEIGGDYNDIFEALADSVRVRTTEAFLLPPGVNEVAILIRDELAPSKLRLFEEAEIG